MKFHLLLSVFALSMGASANAAIQVEVDGRSRPWEVVLPDGLNSDLAFGDPGSYGLSPTSVTNGFDFTAGGVFTFAYVSGFTSPFVSDLPYADADGDTPDGMGYPGYDASDNPGSSGMYFPSLYIDAADYPAYLNALIGAFADATGDVVGAPFLIGNGPTQATAPLGATQILLGFNDDVLDDNTGSLIVSVSGPSAVPEPTAIVAWSLIGIPAIAYGVFRRRRSC